MKKIVMTFLTALAAGCADHTMPVAQLPEIDTNNPLLAEWNTPHETPPFDRIRVSDYEPAFDAAIAVSRAEIDAIVNNPAKPTFRAGCFRGSKVFFSTCSKRMLRPRCSRWPRTYSPN